MKMSQFDKDLEDYRERKKAKVEEDKRRADEFIPCISCDFLIQRSAPSCPACGVVN